LQQEQAQLAALVDVAAGVQDVEPEDEALFPLPHAMQPPPLPSVSRPLELYVLIGHCAVTGAVHAVAPEEETVPGEHWEQPPPLPLLSFPLELYVLTGQSTGVTHVVAMDDEILPWGQAVQPPP
jgi:hypothetical protein